MPYDKTHKRNSRKNHQYSNIQNSTLSFTASITPVTKCDNKERVGSVLNVDFMEMNQPCNCEVKPLFNGQLVFASNVILYDCYSNITVRRSDRNDDTFAISCPKQYTSKVYSVSNISVFEISSDYLTRTGDTGFHQSIQIFQGMGLIFFWRFSPTKLVIYTFNAYIFRYNLKWMFVFLPLVCIMY